MGLLGVFYGIATFYGLKSVAKPLRKIAVSATGQILELVECSREVAYNCKEGLEDIIAEAHYENLKKKQEILDDIEERSGDDGFD